MRTGNWVHRQAWLARPPGVSRKVFYFPLTLVFYLWFQDTRTHVVVELYETERSYVESLEFLVKVSEGNARCTPVPSWFDLLGLTSSVGGEISVNRHRCFAGL